MSIAGTALILALSGDVMVAPSGVERGPTPTTIVQPKARLIVRWSAPPSCPSVGHALAEVMTFAEDSPPSSEIFVVEIAIRSRPNAGFAAEVELAKGPLREHFSFRSTSCEAVTESSLATLEGLFPGFSRTPERAQESDAPTPVRPQRRRRAGAPDNLRLSAIITHLGLPLALAGGGQLELGWSRRQWRIAVGVVGLATSRSGYRVVFDEEEAELEVRWRVLAGRGSGCARLLGRLHAALHACLGVELGGVFATVDPDVNFEASSAPSSDLWLALDLGLRGSFPLTERLSLWTDLSLGVLPRRPRFNVREFATDVAAPIGPSVWWSLRGGLGVELRWGGAV